MFAVPPFLLSALSWARCLQPFAVVICGVAAWTFLLLLLWSLARVVRDAWRRSQRMHRVPCSRCRYFTNDHRLKCAVRPHVANTEAAIGCPDYGVRAVGWTAARR